MPPVYEFAVFRTKVPPLPAGLAPVPVTMPTMTALAPPESTSTGLLMLKVPPPVPRRYALPVPTPREEAA